MKEFELPAIPWAASDLAVFGNNTHSLTAILGP
jgi:hypothetical protein